MARGYCCHCNSKKRKQRAVKNELAHACFFQGMFYTKGFECERRPYWSPGYVFSCEQLVNLFSVSCSTDMCSTGVARGLNVFHTCTLCLPMLSNGRFRLGQRYIAVSVKHWRSTVPRLYYPVFALACRITRYLLSDVYLIPKLLYILLVRMYVLVHTYGNTQTSKSRVNIACCQSSLELD